MENNISFTQQIKNELSNYNEFNIDIKKAILAAFIKINGTLKFSSNDTYLIIRTENAKVAKYIYGLIKEIYGSLNVSFSFRKTMKFYKSTEYLINIKNDEKIILSDLNIDLLESKIPYELTTKEEKIAGLFTGLFLATGSCNSPSTSNYHLEISLNDEQLAKNILKISQKIKTIIIEFKMIKRRNNYVLYIKKSDQISNFLAFINANNSCIEFENTRMMRDYNNVSNRLLNCDTYNYKKSMEKANEQLKRIKIIDEHLGIKNLSNEKLRILCELRLEDIEASYQDLAALMSEKLNKPVSKSNINHLFIKLKEMANKYEEN